jgi:hypothetical protein
MSNLAAVQSSPYSWMAIVSASLAPSSALALSASAAALTLFRNALFISGRV